MMINYLEFIMLIILKSFNSYVLHKDNCYLFKLLLLIMLIDYFNKIH